MITRFLALAVVTAAVVQADDKSPQVVVDEFDGKFDLKWEILNEEEDGYSLETNPGELTLLTLQGSMWRNNENRLAPRNIFLLPEKFQPDDNFEATLHVTSFQPTALYHQVGVLVYQGTDDFIKHSYEWRSEKDPQTCLVLTTETDGEPGGAASGEVLDGPVWIRIRRVDGLYMLDYSNDGDSFIAVHEHEWTPSKPTEPVRVGFLCKKGPNGSPPDIPATVESFRFKRLK